VSNSSRGRRYRRADYPCWRNSRIFWPAYSLKCRRRAGLDVPVENNSWIAQGGREQKMGDVMKQEREMGPVMSIRVSKDERTQDALNKCGTLPSSTHENNIHVAAAGQLPANIYGALRQFSFHYSEMVRERSRLAVAAGRVPWRAPIGYVNISSNAGPTSNQTANALRSCWKACILLKT
jgi:hypothetical protein